MRPSKARFVTACQQLLALGVVLAVLTPAASVITLDVVSQAPRAPRAGRSGRAAGGQPVGVQPRGEAGGRRPDRTGGRRGRGVRADDGRDRGARSPPAATARAKLGSLSSGSPADQPRRARSRATAAWASPGTPASTLDDHDAHFSVRTRTDGDTWSDWLELEYHDEHAPDPDSREAREGPPGHRRRPGRHVDEVQVRGVMDGAPSSRPTCGWP